MLHEPEPPTRLPAAAPSPALLPAPVDLPDRLLVGSERRFREIFERIALGVGVTDLKGCLLEANPALYRILGMAEPHLLGRSILEFSHPEDVELESRLFRELVAGERETVELEKRMVRPDATIILCRLTGTLVHDAGGVPRLAVGILEDVTERQRLQERLEREQRLLAQAEAIAHLGSWEWNYGANELIWSEEVERIFELKPGPFDETYQAFLARVHPDDLVKFEGVVASAKATQALWELEHRIVLPDRRVRTIFVRAMLELDGAGEPVRLAGTVQDVTERKRMEAERTASVRRFKAVFDGAPIGIGIVDIEGRMLECNPFLLRMLGYTEEELVGLTFQALTHPEDRAHSLTLFRSLVACQVERFQIVTRYLRKDGLVAWARLTMARAVLAEGAPPFVIGMVEDVSKEIEAERRVQHMAWHDALTDLPNRAMFMNRLKQVIAAAAHSERLVALHFLDLDQFKLINDTHGHPVGDQVLQAVAKRLSSVIRATDTLTRLGGDEFAVIQSGFKRAEEASVLAKKLLAALDEPLQVEEHHFRTSGSIGIALFPQDESDPEHLLKNADLALYKAKALGRGSFQFFSADLNDAARLRLRLETDLRGALERRELQLFYQPRLELKSRSVIGMEALLRWHHQELGLVSPAQFIPVAEETGEIIAIGEWVLDEACRQARAWQEAGLPPLTVAVNLSAMQLNQLHEERLLRAVERALRRSGLAPAHLELELTESILMRNRDGALLTLERLRELGVCLSIDDFGTGYSSLSYLSKFPIQVLKIDQSFIRNMLENPSDAAIVRSVIALGHSLGLKVLAEGVETEEQLRYLRRRGCDEIQGFLVGRPVPPERFPPLVERRL